MVLPGAGDIKKGARAIGAIGQKPAHRRGNLVRRACPAKGECRAQPLHSIGLTAARMDVGVDNARADHIYSDTFSRDFLRKPDAKRVDSPFGCRVVHVLSRGAKSTGRRRDEDYRPAISAAEPRHPNNRFAATQDRANDVDVKDLPYAARIHGIDARYRTNDAGVGDQSRETAEVIRVSEGGNHCGLVADVGLHCSCSSSPNLDITYYSGGRAFVLCVC